MQNELDLIVKEMLEKHQGGEEFFNHLDQAVQQNPIVNQIYKKAYFWIVESRLESPAFIVSGKFGRFFDNWHITEPGIYESLPIIVVNGGMRKGIPIDRLTYLKDLIKDRAFIFIDDSFYSGKTRNAVKAEIVRLGGALFKTFVIYDGSVTQDPDVESLYRYHKEESILKP